MVDVRKVFYRLVAMLAFASAPAAALLWQWLAISGPDWLRAAASAAADGSPVNMVCVVGFLLTLAACAASFIWAADNLDSIDKESK